MGLHLKHITAIVLVGDGLLAMVNPERDALAWRMGPEPFRSLMGYMAKKLNLTAPKVGSSRCTPSPKAGRAGRCTRRVPKS